MKSFKNTALITLLAITLVSFSHNFNCVQKNSLESFKTNKDSVIVFKSKTFSIIPIKKSDTIIDIDSNIQSISLTTYHIINFDKKYIESLMYNNQSENWKSLKLPYIKQNKINSERTDFICLTEENEEYIISFIDNKKIKSLVYNLSQNEILFYTDIIEVDQKTIIDLEISNESNLEEVNNSTNDIIIKEQVKDFEYSEHWRKESYKKVIEFMNQRIKKENPNCRIVSRGYYDSNLIQYTGNQGFLVKYYCEYDCDKNHINQSYFWIQAYYLGYGKWNLQLVDQKLTH